MADCKILMIDDDEDLRETMKIILESNGYDTISAENGTKGLKLLKKEKPDLILLDVTMPEIDGFQVLEKLKKDKNTVAIPVVMLTAREDVEYKRKAAQLFNEGYLTKPVEFSVLKSTIENIFKRRGEL